MSTSQNSETPSQILKRYKNEYETNVTPLFPLLYKAAEDTSLPTDFLIKKATEIIREERNSNEEIYNIPLLILQQRTCSEDFETVLLLLKDKDPAVRQLGAQILREYPSLNKAPYPYSPKIITHLIAMIENEKDEEVLSWALSAIGWQCHPDGVEYLLKYIDDERDFIRTVVGDNLTKVYNEDDEIDATIAEALLKLARDVYLDIRWSVFYDIAEYPKLFTTFKNEFKAAAELAKQDPDETVREQAERALKQLSVM